MQFVGLEYRIGFIYCKDNFIHFRFNKGTNIVNNRVMITGEIPRFTEFEKGFRLQYKVKNKFELVPDPLVKDDQALVMNIKDKGLLILTGCGHPGIINTIKYAKKRYGC